MLVVVLAFAGAGLIADDLKHSALQLYFARPLGKKDYLIGKMAVVAFFVLILTAVPGISFSSSSSSSSPAVSSSWPNIPGCRCRSSDMPALLTLFFAFYVLLLSASSRNTPLRHDPHLRRPIFFRRPRRDPLRDLPDPVLRLFSLPANLQQAGAVLFGAEAAARLPGRSVVRSSWPGSAPCPPPSSAGRSAASR